MTATIRWEFALGKNGLPEVYSGFFTGQVQRLLKDDSIAKDKWLRYIWNAQDRVSVIEGLGAWERNQMAATFIQIYKRRRKCKLGE